MFRENLLADKEAEQPVASDAERALETVLREGRSVVAEVSLRHKAGHRIPVRMEAVPIRNSHGSIVGAAESFSATITATEGEQRQQRLQDYGYIDEATTSAKAADTNSGGLLPRGRPRSPAL